MSKSKHKRYLENQQEKKPKIVAAQVRHQRIEISPLPPPEKLKQYQELYPKAGKFFFETLQKQTAHRILERFERLHKLLVKDEAPWPEAKINKKKKWMCNYCDYAEECNKIS